MNIINKIMVKIYEKHSHWYQFEVDLHIQMKIELKLYYWYWILYWNMAIDYWNLRDDG